MYRRYTFGSNEAEWSEAEALVDLSSPLEATGFDIAMNAMGEAILLWEQSGDGKQVYAQVYAPGQDKELNENGWSSADTLIGEGHGSNRKCITSPSLTMYSLPSKRHLPASLAPDSPLYCTKSS